MAMVKIVSPSGWDWDTPVASLVKIASGGLRGHDRSCFIKRASGSENVFLPFLDSIKFAADEEPVHLIALGASEAYGPNRNGDGFKEATLKEAHDTFVKFARFYRNHKNKDPRISYGVVKLSAYNPRMRRVELLCALNREKSAADRNGGFVADKELTKLARGDDLAVSMACALPGTLVKVRHGFVPIEDVEPGDEVLTKYGRYRPVYATLRRTKQHVARITTRFYGRQVLEFTPDHKFWVARWQDVPAPPQRNGLRSADPTGYSKAFRKKYRDVLHAYARYVPCGDLRPGDFLLMPIERGDGSSSLGRREARLLGYYMAEGSVTSDGHLCFTRGVDDDFVREVGDLTDAKHSSCPHPASALAVNVTIYDKAGAAAVVTHTGRGARNKVVPGAVVDAPADVKLEFLAGWFNGDGWQDKKGLHWSTRSRTLSLELQNLLASVGVPASVYRIDHTSDSPDGCKRTGDGTEYTVNVSNRYSALFAGRSKADVIELRADKTTVFITGDYLAVPVAAVEVREEVREVYDISVEEDESFTAFGLAVSNCRVPYDECSYCGHKARTRDEYCTSDTCKAGGCKDNLTRLVKQGGDVHILHVNNPHPNFFDISDVFRPADRIAYGTKADWFQKAASDGGFMGVDGAKLAQDLGVMAPLAVILAQDTMPPGGWPPYLAAQVKLAHGLDVAEQKEGFQLPADVKRAFAADVQPEVNLRELELDPERPQKMAAALGALADQKVVLSLRDFARMTKRAALTEDAAACLPGVYGRMIADGSLERRLAQNKYAPAEKLASYRQRCAAVRLRPSHGLDKEAVDRRIALSTIRQHRVPGSKSGFGDEKRASDSPLAEELARDYAVYKVAALQRIAETDGDFVLTVRLGMCQNQVV